jgi:hypothetical protein
VTYNRRGSSASATYTIEREVDDLTAGNTPTGGSK